MRNILLLAIGLMACPAVLAQTLTGAWQGTLKAGGKDLRIIFKITTTDADTLKAVMYSIDQTPQPIPTAGVTRQGTNIKIAVPGAGANYEGKLSADGNSMTGTWSQGPNPIPLNLEHATTQTAWAIPDASAAVAKMAVSADPSFEVATIKPSDPERQGKVLTIRNGNIITINNTLADLLKFVYGLNQRQITGAPEWASSAKFDITAKPDTAGQPNDKQIKSMLAKLLADRFKLTFHREKREQSVYVVVPGKTAPKLTKNEGDPNGLPSLGFRGLGSLFASNATIADLASLLQGAVLDKPVLDQSGLTGRFDFTLTWTPDQFQFADFGVKVPPPNTAADAPPDLFTAFQQQLGLKLEATKAQADVFVIDKVEKPSAN